jgi:hypothetical protein
MIKIHWHYPVVVVLNCFAWIIITKYSTTGRFVSKKYNDVTDVIQ